MTSSLSPAQRLFVFQCNGNTYLECIEKSLFGSNDPWPLQVEAGDYCLLLHYEYETLFGLWQATASGGKRLVAKAWGGKFPFQVRVALVTPTIVELPQGTLGMGERVVEGDRATKVIAALLAGTRSASRRQTPMPLTCSDGFWMQEAGPIPPNSTRGG